MTSPRHYKAFISYSHSDEQWACWLQRSLEKYKLPKTFRQSHPELMERLIKAGFNDPRYQPVLGDE